MFSAEENYKHLSGDDILREARLFASRLKTVFGEDLLQALLYGSVARNTFHLESDVDIALIFTEAGFRSFDFKGNERSWICNQMEIDFYNLVGMPLSLYIRTKEQFEKEQAFGSSFIKNLVRDSIDLLKE